MKKYFVIAFFALCGLHFSFSQIMFKSKGSFVEPSVSLRYGEGTKNIIDFNGLSQKMNFDISRLLMLNLRSKMVLSKDFSVGVNVANSIEGVSGGQWSYNTISTGLSMTSNVQINQAYDYDIYLSSKFFFKNFELFIGFKELFFKWDAFGGTQSDGTQIFSNNHIAATYQQKLDIPYIGFFYSSVNYFRGAFFEFSASYSPLVYVSDRYIDHINNSRQFGTFDNGQYYTAKININQPISEHAYIRLGATYHNLLKVKGALKQVIYSTATTTTTTTRDADAGEMSNSFFDFNLALGFSF